MLHTDCLRPIVAGRLVLIGICKFVYFIGQQERLTDEHTYISLPRCSAGF